MLCPVCNSLYLGLTSWALNPRQDQLSAAKKKITSLPNEWRNIPFLKVAKKFYLFSGLIVICLRQHLSSTMHTSINKLDHFVLKTLNCFNFKRRQLRMKRALALKLLVINNGMTQVREQAT